MTSSTTQVIDQATRPDGWVPVFWEPVANTSERLMIGALVRFRGQISAHRIIRDDVLDCLYGKRAKELQRLMEFALGDLRIVAHERMDAAGASMGGFVSGEFHATKPTSVGDALRVAALMYSSLANLDHLDDLDVSDTPQPEEANQRFATAVREAVVERKPELETYFGRSAVLIEGGEPVRFGFCSQAAVVHFGVLHAVRQGPSVRDARARLWEISRARELAHFRHAELIMAAPRQDDPTLSTRQVDSLRRNLREIEREADSYSMRFTSVTDVPQAADRVLEIA